MATARLNKAIQEAEKVLSKGKAAPKGGEVAELLMEGRLRGTVIEDADFLLHKKNLAANKIDLVRNSSLPKELQLTERQAAATRLPNSPKNPTGRLQIVIRDDATYFEFLHEFLHSEFTRLNPAMAGNKLAQEQFVYDSLKNGIFWKALTAEERAKSTRYIISLGGKP